MGISLEQALKRCDFRGERALPLFAPSGAWVILEILIYIFSHSSEPNIRSLQLYS